MVTRLVAFLGINVWVVASSVVPEDFIDRLVEDPFGVTDAIANYYVESMDKITLRDNDRTCRDMCDILLSEFQRDLCSAWEKFDDEILFQHTEFTASPSYLKEVLSSFDECQTRIGNERLDYPAHLLWLGTAMNKNLTERLRGIRRKRIATTEDKKLRHLFETNI